MTNLITNWSRDLLEPYDQSPFLFYVVFGAAFNEISLSGSQYRCSGIPDNVDLSVYGPGASPEALDRLRTGFLWDLLQEENPALAQAIGAQTRCTVLQGNVADQSSLNYFRDCIGLLTWLLDQDGAAIYDPQSFKWWSREEWQQQVFSPARPLPARHVTILASEEDNGTRWFHTRGLRKFGRPDLSIHNVTDEYRDAVYEMCNRFIEMLALGYVIKEGQEIKMDNLPRGMICVPGGDEDDPDFNNFHVEIKWP